VDTSGRLTRNGRHDRSEVLGEIARRSWEVWWEVAHRIQEMTSVREPGIRHDLSWRLAPRRHGGMAAWRHGGIATSRIFPDNSRVVNDDERPRVGRHAK
jgi:hypothetical protein